MAEHGRQPRVPIPSRPRRADATDVTPEAAPDAGDGRPAADASHDIPMPAHLREAIAARLGPRARRCRTPPRPDVAPYTGEAPGRAVRGTSPARSSSCPAGALQVRANDTDYAFRAASSFTWLTGETVADAVLVMTPTAAATTAPSTCASTPSPARSTTSPAASTARCGWATSRASTDTAGVLGLTHPPARARSADDLAPLPRRPRRSCCAASTPRSTRCCPAPTNDRLAQVLDELRLVKDDWELDRLRHACEATARGFADVVRELPHVVGRADLRGERWLEGTFWRRARLEGNDVGYTSILGAGRARHDAALVAQPRLDRAPATCCWPTWASRPTSCTPPTSPAPCRSTASGRRRSARSTAPCSRRRPAGIAEVKAGADFLAAHRAAMYVIADHLHSWGILPVTADVVVRRRPRAAGRRAAPPLHAARHVAHARHRRPRLRRRRATRSTATARWPPGYVLTVEPGLYFQANDLSVPAELRGIGVRIEDDIVVTDGDPVNLSAHAAARPGRDHGVDARGPEHAGRARDAAMADLVLRPQRGLPHGLVIPDAELVERFSRSSGPGGQSVNTTDSRVELRWDVAPSTALDRRAAGPAAATGWPPGSSTACCSIVASEQRSQLQNRTAARARLGYLLAEALAPAAARATRRARPRRAARPAGWRPSDSRGDLKAHAAGVRRPGLTRGSDSAIRAARARLGAHFCREGTRMTDDDHDRRPTDEPTAASAARRLLGPGAPPRPARAGAAVGSVAAAAARTADPPTRDRHPTRLPASRRPADAGPHAAARHARQRRLPPRRPRRRRADAGARRPARRGATPGQRHPHPARRLRPVHRHAPHRRAVPGARRVPRPLQRPGQPARVRRRRSPRPTGPGRC